VRSPEDIIITRRECAERIGAERADIEAIYGGRGRLSAAAILNNRTGRHYVWMKNMLSEYEMNFTGTLSGRSIRWDLGRFEFHYLEGKLHREGEPADLCEYESGMFCRRWYISGRLHRDGGPAIETNTMEKWFINGQRRRPDGPATICYQSLPQRKRGRVVSIYYKGHDSQPDGWVFLDEHGQSSQADITIDEDIPF